MWAESVAGRRVSSEGLAKCRVQSHEWRVPRETPARSSVETKFIRVAEALAIGSWRDGWLVVWCQPDRQRVLWHVMLIRPRVEFRGCCD